MSSQKRIDPEKSSDESSDEHDDEVTVSKTQFKKQKTEDNSEGSSSVVVMNIEEKTDSSDEDYSDYDKDDSFSDDDAYMWDDDYCHHFDYKFGNKTPEIQLEGVETMLSVWKMAKIKISETLQESEKLLTEIKGILVECRNVGKSTVETLVEKTCEMDEVFLEIQDMKDKIASEIKSFPGQNLADQLSLQFKSSVLQAQCEILTKMAFGESKRGIELTKKSEDHERRILALIVSQKERLVYYDEMIITGETDKGNILDKMEHKHLVNLQCETDIVNGVKILEEVGDTEDETKIVAGAKISEKKGGKSGETDSSRKRTAGSM